MPQRQKKTRAVRDIAQQANRRVSLSQKQQQLNARLSADAKKKARIQGKWSAGSQKGMRRHERGMGR